jgi:hypothetical protein
LGEGNYVTTTKTAKQSIAVVQASIHLSLHEKKIQVALLNFKPYPGQPPKCSRQPGPTLSGHGTELPSYSQ